MTPDFWLQKWADRQIAFHKSEANPALVDHLGTLSLPSGSRVFVPLCGKTRDIGWLLSEGRAVAGVELAEQAVDELFEELGLRPDTSTVGNLTRRSARDIDIFVGDFFDLSRETLGRVDAIYDRAALVALPRAMREQYAAHLKEITSAAPQLLLTFEYDEAAIEGPPFSVSADEVRELYGDSYHISLLSHADVAGGLKGSAAHESVWKLHPKR